MVYIQRKRREAQLVPLPMGIIQDGAPEMWNLVESAVTKAMPSSRFEKGIDRFHLTERLAASLKALRDPCSRDRESTLNEWRMKLESSDDAIDEITSLLDYTARTPSRKYSECCVIRRRSRPLDSLDSTLDLRSLTACKRHPMQRFLVRLRMPSL